MNMLKAEWVAIVLLLGLLAACTEPSSESDQVLSTGDRPNLTSAATVTVVAVGDIAGCPEVYQDERTAALVAGIPGTILTLGDHAYENGSVEDFRCYDASWGRFKSRTRPAIGNHEYNTPNAAGYFGYFGSRAGPAGRGYYSFNLGNWHIVSLSSERDFAAQANWLKADLAANPRKCTLAFWHKPLFTSGKHPPEPAMRPLFKVLYNARADLVLTGHQHNYERFGPQDYNGVANQSRGIVHFVSGGGGAPLHYFLVTQPNSLKRIKALGVLKLELGPDRYTHTFITLDGTKRDVGTRLCH
jgi:hypothetical protein